MAHPFRAALAAATVVTLVACTDNSTPSGPTPTTASLELGDRRSRR